MGQNRYRALDPPVKPEDDNRMSEYLHHPCVRQPNLWVMVSPPREVRMAPKPKTPLKTITGSSSGCIDPHTNHRLFCI